MSSLGENVKVARQKRAQQAYDDLLNTISGNPLLVLYASDGGAAEKKAKRLAMRGKARGLSTTLAVLDSVALEDLAKEEFVAFVTSVAGQGEPPQNARTFFKALNAAIAKGEAPLKSVKYSVFGMGDSHYWPRPEDAHYYNRAGKDLDARLAALGAERFAEIGLGDDQDSDGSETGYKLWEPLVWKALGVDNVEITEAEPDPITNEHLKAASNFLRGTIVEGLEDNTTGALAASDTQLTKFHGIYQQDDRDIRDERQALGAEPAYSFMIRVRMPGGVCSAKQWLAMDQISDEHGNGTFKITTRQTFQFHGVIKRHLKPTIQSINRVLLDTLAACGDVNRYVHATSFPFSLIFLNPLSEMLSALRYRRCLDYTARSSTSRESLVSVCYQGRAHITRFGSIRSSLLVKLSRTLSLCMENSTSRERLAHELTLRLIDFVNPPSFISSRSLSRYRPRMTLTPLRTTWHLLPSLIRTAIWQVSISVQVVAWV